MAYLTIDEFEAYGGSDIGDEAFARLELKARRLIDRMTHGRIRDESEARESVKMCAFELIALMHAEESESGIGGREIAGASNDGVSVSYRESGTAAQRTVNIVRTWLEDETTESGMPILYAGVD